MRFEDIPRTEIRTHMPREVQRLQKNAPKYVQAIIENSRSFPEVKSLAELKPGAIEMLAGGETSALYSVQTEKTFVVIKLRADGIEAEREALEAWSAHRVRVPAIRRKGTIRISPQSKIKYLLFDFIVDRKGEGAPTGTDYLKRSPGRTQRMGQLLGRTLARMHRAKSKRTFGEFSDRSGANTVPLKSWNRYLQGYIRLHYKYLIRLGLSRSLLKELMHTIEHMNFPTLGTYVHGDYSLRNIMVQSSKPLKIVVFDPNPIIGDPSWDVAILFNNRDYSRRLYEWEPTVAEYRNAYKSEQRFFEGFWKSYRLASKEKITLDKIWLSQLIQTIIHLQAEERKEYKDTAEKELQIRVRREALFQHFGTLTLPH